MTLPPTRKVSHIATAFYMRARVLMAGHRFERYASKLERLFSTFDLGPEFFGEGITTIKDRVFQLTWKSGVGFVYDLNSFHLLRKFAYSGEGWGLATDGRELFLSDGTSEIRILDAKTFQKKPRLRVHDGATPSD